MIKYALAIFCVATLLILNHCNPKTLSPDEFMVEVTMCHQQGKLASPVYDKKDPIKVYRINCVDKVPSNEVSF